MLEGLNDIDWSVLDTAYGPANSVPENLLLLISPMRREQWLALEQLSMAVCHQACTVYSATPFVVPFLLELAANPQTAPRSDILQLLGEIAGATGYVLAHHVLWSPKERASAETEKEMEHERQIVTASREAVWHGLDLYLALLGDPDPYVTVSAAGVLAELTRRADENVPSVLRSPDPFARMAQALRDRFHRETDLRVRKALVPSLLALSSKDTECAKLLQFLVTEGEDFPLRLQAILCLVEDGREPIPEPALRLLADLWQTPKAGVSYYDAEFPEPTQEEDEPEETEPASLREALYVMRRDLDRDEATEEEGDSPFIQAVRESQQKLEQKYRMPLREMWMRRAVFLALRQVGERYPDVFLPVLQAAFEVYMRSKLGLPGNTPLTQEHWAQLHAVGELGDNDIEELVCDGLMGMLAPCVNIEKICLYPAPVTDAGLADLPRLAHLRDINIAGTAVTDAGVRELLRFPMLEKLSLTYTAVSDAAMEMVAALPSLRDLWAVRTEIGDAGAAALARSSTIEVLNLSETRIGDAGAISLARMPSLSELNLSETVVGDVGAAALARFGRLCKLTLDRTNVGDAGLAALTTSSTLEVLSLSGTQVSDAGLVHLSRMTGVKELCLHNTGITDAGLRHLYGLRGLKHLNLRMTQVTNRGIRQLGRALHSCKILG